MSYTTMLEPAYSSPWTVSDTKGLGMSDAFQCLVHTICVINHYFLIFRYYKQTFLLISPELTYRVKCVKFTQVKNPIDS